MKKFFKYLFITFSGTLLGLISFFALSIGIIAIIIASSNSDIEIKQNSILVIRLHEPIVEMTTYNPMSGILPYNSDSEELGVHNILQAITDASGNPNISGIILYTDLIQAGYSTVYELRNALQKFKKSGKFIYSYSDMVSQKSYLLNSVADKIYMSPQGMFELKGITSEFISIKNLLAKIGITPVVFKAGKYKSFVETFTSEKMSPENKEQVKAVITDIWQNYSQSISNSRKSLVMDVPTLADSLFVWDAESAKQYGLVDSLLNYDEFLNLVAKKINVSKISDISTIALKNYIEYTKQNKSENEPVNKSKIAIIVASGGINMGKGDEKSIGSETVSKLIRDARLDESIKAIVVRINSGGGSALASEIIWREMKLAADTKPLVVSMGDVAASGGYYIAAPAHAIVANPTTITGSIGVFGMLVNTENLLAKIGITVDSVKTSNYSDLGSPVRPVSNYEFMTITKSIDKIYSLFKKRVSEGRHLSLDEVESIAQGRIWSGVDAQRIGLVDTLGDISTAISIAAKKAKISSSYSVEYFPKTKTPIEQVLEIMGDKETAISKELTEILGKEYSHLYYLVKELPHEKGVYSQIPYILKIE